MSKDDRNDDNSQPDQPVNDDKSRDSWWGVGDKNGKYWDD